MDQQIRVLKRQRELEQDSLTAAAKDRAAAALVMIGAVAKEWAFGVNWYSERRIKFAINYGQTSFDGGAAGGADREEEKALLTRFQVAF